MSDRDIRQIFSGQTSDLEERLRQFARELVIDARDQVRGSLPNRNLAPLQLTNPDLFDGLLLISRGGTSADLSGTGPGVLVQAGLGSPVTVGPLAFGYIDWASTGTHTTGQPLLYDSSGPTADFGPLDLSLGSPIVSGTLGAGFGGTGRSTYAVGDILYASAATTLSRLAGVATGNALISGGVTTAPSWGKIGLTTHVSGILAGTNGGTGVNNGARTLTVNTNSGTIDFTAAGKTLSINVDATIDSGTYTPTYQGSTTGGVTTYTAQQGSWWRFGQAIFFTITLAWTAATGTGNVRILLPFTAANVTNQNSAANLYHAQVTFANGSVVALISQNSNLVRLFSPATNAAGTEVAIEATGTFAMSGCYFI